MRAPNVTLDIYLGANTPPNTPDTSEATGHLRGNFRSGQEANEGDRTFVWSHLLEVPLGVDLRDTYPTAPARRIFIPHTEIPGDGQEYRVVFVERVRHVRGQNFHRVFLNRWALREPSMPLTLREVDLTPSYTTVNIIEVDQADGFVLSEPVAGQIRLDLDFDVIKTRLNLALDDLTDVNAPTPGAGQYLKFNGTEWVNADLDVNPAIGNLNDVILTGLAGGDTLVYNGTVWVNEPLANVATSGSYGDLTGTPDLSGYLESGDVAVADFNASAIIVESEGIAANDNDTTLPTSAAVKDYVDDAVAAISGVPAGTIIAYGGNATPSGWLACDGSAVSRTTYAALYTAIGVIWGTGDGSTTFTLPDLRGRTAVGRGTGTGLTNRILGTTGGAETHTLTTSEIPAHTHSTNIDAGATMGAPAGGSSYQCRGTPGTPIATGSTGGGSAHNNMQPWLAVNYLIKT